MATLLEVTKAEYLEGYRLIVRFNDAAVKLVDLTGYLRKPHLALRKEDGRIRRFQVDLGRGLGRSGAPWPWRNSQSVRSN